MLTLDLQYIQLVFYMYFLVVREACLLLPQTEAVEKQESHGAVRLEGSHSFLAGALTAVQKQVSRQTITSNSRFLKLPPEPFQNDSHQFLTLGSLWRPM